MYKRQVVLLEAKQTLSSLDDSIKIALLSVAASLIGGFVVRIFNDYIYGFTSSYYVTPGKVDIRELIGSLEVNVDNISAQQLRLNQLESARRAESEIYFRTNMSVYLIPVVVALIVKGGQVYLWALLVPVVFIIDAKMISRDFDKSIDLNEKIIKNVTNIEQKLEDIKVCLLYTSPSPRD